MTDGEFLDIERLNNPNFQYPISSSSSNLLLPPLTNSEGSIGNKNEDSAMTEVQNSLVSDFNQELTVNTTKNTKTTETKKRRRAVRRLWTEDENQRLVRAVEKYGEYKMWPTIAKEVGTRNTSQCKNKWRSMKRSPNVHRWNSSDTALLDNYVNDGLNNQEILSLMNEYGYFQVNQQLKIARMNHSPWTDDENIALIRFKQENVLTDTEIGHRLNNRSRGDVKKQWTKVKKSKEYQSFFAP